MTFVVYNTIPYHHNIEQIIKQKYWLRNTPVVIVGFVDCFSNIIVCEPLLRMWFNGDIVIDQDRIRIEMFHKISVTISLLRWLPS